MTVITALPAAPNPLTDSQPDYNAKALAFTQALLPFVTEVNTVAGEINAAAAAAAQSAIDAHTNGAAQVALAAAQANAAAASASFAADSASVASSVAGFVGLWSALTGPLTMPASVKHNGQFWLLAVSIADVTTHEPGISPAWVSADGARILTIKNLLSMG